MILKFVDDKEGYIFLGLSIIIFVIHVKIFIIHVKNDSFWKMIQSFLIESND